MFENQHVFLQEDEVKCDKIIQYLMNYQLKLCNFPSLTLNIKKNEQLAQNLFRKAKFRQINFKQLSQLNKYFEMGNNKSSEATVNGVRVFRNSSSNCYSSSSYENQRVIKVWIRSCRLLHGSYSWLATLAANTLSAGISAPIQHWWVVFQSNQAYYSINIWTNDVITMERDTSWAKINQNGLACSDKTTDADQWTEKSSSCNRSVSQVYEFLKSNVKYTYSLVSNNCQDISKKIYNWA